MKTKIVIIAQLSLCALLISAATTASLKDNRTVQLKAKSLQEETYSELMQRVSVRSQQVPGKHDAMQRDKNLRLQTDIAAALQVSEQHIQWIISQRDKVVSTLQGNLQDIQLPAGSYKIKLSVGNYSREQQVSIQAAQQLQPYFNNNVARLQLRSNQAVNWLITGPDKRSYRINSTARPDELLPAGHYTVRAVFGDITLHKKIHIRAGQSLQTTLDIPLGKVRLIATKNDQPLFKTVTWDVYRITNGKRKLIGNYHLHNRAISMPPGHYEAAARYKGITGKRQFRVQEGNTNHVILALN